MGRCSGCFDPSFEPVGVSVGASVAVVRNAFEVRVDGRDVVLGNVAFVRCLVPEALREFVRVTAWLRGDETLLPEQADVGACVCDGSSV